MRFPCKNKISQDEPRRILSGITAGYTSDEAIGSTRFGGSAAIIRIDEVRFQSIGLGWRRNMPPSPET